jgi:hypothetical protein
MGIVKTPPSAFRKGQYTTIENAPANNDLQQNSFTD